MNKLLLALLMSASALVATPAMAVSLSAANLNGNGFTDYSGEGLLALDINAINSGVLTFDVNFSAAEIAAGSVSFNAVINNFLASGISSLNLDFGFGPIVTGTAQSAFNAGAAGSFNVSSDGVGSYVVRNLSVPYEHFGVLVGNPYAEGSNVDWLINTSALNAADTYSFSIQAVPEPGTLAMLLAGLGMLGVTARRRIKG